MAAPLPFSLRPLPENDRAADVLDANDSLLGSLVLHDGEVLAFVDAEATRTMAGRHEIDRLSDVLRGRRTPKTSW